MHAHETAKPMLAELIGAFVDHPDGVKVGVQAADDGACYWAVACSQIDEGKLIGQKGSHVRALTLLVEQIGSANRRPWTFRLVTTNYRRAKETAEPRDVVEHDPRPHRDLLCRLLDALGLKSFSVEVGPGAGERRSLTFEFIVRSTAADDYLLTAGNDAGETVGQAIDTLLRAIAKRSGVRYSLAFAR